MDDRDAPLDEWVQSDPGSCSTSIGVAQGQARIIDDHALAAVKVAEESERDTPERIAAAMHGSAT